VEAHAHAVAVDGAQFDGTIGQQHSIAGLDVVCESRVGRGSTLARAGPGLGSDRKLPAGRDHTAFALAPAQADFRALQIEQQATYVPCSAAMARTADIRAACSD
jgi:hypothetical protein